MRNPVPVRLRPLYVEPKYGGRKGQRSSKWKRIAKEAMKRDGYRCTACGRGIKEGTLSVDHIIPMASGGQDSLMNARTLCEWCHPALEQAEKNSGGGKKK